ncbi:MAG: hypothetical protein ACP5H8_01375 [Candidatus Micrarchaeia archaeon]
MEIRGILNLDLAVSFIIMLFLFYLCVSLMLNIVHNAKNNIYLDSEVSLKIARSYEVISHISSGRDNEIDYSRIISDAPKNVSLQVMNGYIYGGPSDYLCIKRAVYIRDLKEVGILEVC